MLRAEQARLGGKVRLTAAAAGGKMIATRIRIMSEEFTMFFWSHAPA